MSIIKVEPTKYDQPSKVKKIIKYLYEKKEYAGINYASEPYMVHKHGLLADINESDELAEEILSMHELYYADIKQVNPVRHIWIDFNNSELSLHGAAIIAEEINTFWEQHYVAYIQGVHVYKKGHSGHLGHNDAPCNIYCPHVHVVVSTRIMGGPMVGKYLNIDKEMISQYKTYANKILINYHLDTIKMDYIYGGSYDIPEGFDAPLSAIPLISPPPFYIHPSFL